VILAPGATIGILGGGQLGRMLAMAAARLGFDAAVFTPETNSPAARVAAHTIEARFEEREKLLRFARAADVVTFEFENVPADAVAFLEGERIRVAPGSAALAASQDRLAEKRFLGALGIAVAPFAAVLEENDIAAACAETGLPAILKTSRFGYDGLGQARVHDVEATRDSWRDLGAQPCILEGVCAFEREISIIAARSEAGATAFYDVSENLHDGGILLLSRSPAGVSAAIAASARASAEKVLTALNYVGVLAIEFFVMPDGRLIANEMAPRVHNSGHWTIEGAATSQFEQHIRAIAGWPLGPTTRLGDVEMVNLIGADAERWAAYAADPAARLHLYGKQDARAGRKMGHVTRVTRKGQG